MLNSISLGGLRDLQENHGAKHTGAVIADAIQSREISPRAFTFRGLFEALVGSVGDLNVIGVGTQDFNEAVTSSAFPKITAALVNMAVQEAYEREPSFWQDLFIDIPSNHISEWLVGIDDVDAPEEVDEALPYPETGFAEKSTQVTGAKFGRLLDITWETIRFDQTGKILTRANQIGVKAKQFENKKAVEAIQAVGYLAANNNRPTTFALASKATVEAAETALRAQVDSKGEPISVMLKVAVAGRTANQLLRRVIGAPFEAAQGGSGDVGFAGSPNPYNGVLNIYAPQMSAHEWYIGDPKGQFVRTTVQPLQFLTRPNAGMSDDGWKRDIIHQFKVWMFAGWGARDAKFLYQGNDGTVTS